MEVVCSVVTVDVGSIDVVVDVSVVGSGVVVKLSQDWSSYQLGMRSLKFVPLEQAPLTNGSNSRESRMSQAS